MVMARRGDVVQALRVQINAKQVHFQLPLVGIDANDTKQVNVALE
jgi:hypothetical protein